MLRLTIIFLGAALLCFAGNGSPARDLLGLHNVLEVMPGLLSGSVPEGDDGFASLQKLGIKTIITVDGAKPDLERAKKAGMRYIHLPIGYNGIAEEQALRIARAVRDLPKPIYLHCHHGKHRGPAAAAVARLCLDERCTVEAAVAFMQKAGTDKRYAGLYDAAKKFVPVKKADLDKISGEFPEMVQVSALAQLMVEVDEHWEHLKLVKKANWKTPPQHPDLDPAHEASILAERYRLAAKQAKVDECKTWFADAERNAQVISQLLKPAKNAKMDTGEIEKAYQRMTNDCTRCHAKYRDVPMR